jgi:sortase (surface protein transpeptidase)
MTIDLNNDDKDKLYFYEKQPIKKVSSTIQMQKIDTNSNGQITNMTCPPIPMGRESKSVIIATEMIDGKKSDDGFSMKPTSVIQKSVPHLEDLKLIGSKDSI